MTAGSVLIIVPGHGVCRQGCTAPDLVCLDSSWVGIFPGEGRFYVEHIRAGACLARAGDGAILVFSGGQTREEAGRRSEADSYWEIAEATSWWGSTTVRKRSVKEQYARDSFENLLFSLALFRQHTGRWPLHISVCGWQFKASRYDLHRQALQWPQDRFTYVGVNNPADAELPKAIAGEQAKVESVRDDPFLIGPKWVAQREQRDPFRCGHPYRGVDAALDALLDGQGRGTFTGRMPWAGR